MTNGIFLDDGLRFLRTLPDKSIDLIITDPPYEIETTGGGGTVNRVKKLQDSLTDLAEANLTNGYDIEEYGEEFLRVLKTPNLYIWCNKKQIPRYFDFFVNKHRCKFDIITWYKTNALPTYYNKYLTDAEYCLYFRKGGKCFPRSYDDAKTCYIAPINHKDKKLYRHPTIKPLDLIEKFVRNSSEENDVVLDCFLGSGTTGVACKKLNRNFIGVEINETYYDIAKQRIENLTKQQLSFFDD